MKHLLSILFLIFVVRVSFAQHTIPAAQPGTDDKHGLVKWLSFAEAQELNKKQQKPFLVDIYTDWCGWCKHMMRTTYSNPGISNYINTYFYPVQLDAESKDTIEYQGVKYFNESPKPKSTHQLAIKFLGNNQSYPSTVFLCNNLQYTLNTAGYLDEKAIEPILVFCVENIWRSVQFDDFKKYFNKAFIEQKEEDKTLNVYTLEEAQKLHAKKPRKWLLLVNTDWCNSCKIMKKTTFSDSLNKEYVNKNYYFVNLNPEQLDSVLFQGKTYKKSGKYGPFNDFVIEKCGGNLQLPTLLVWDETLNKIDMIPYYLTPEAINPILHFYAEDAYKSMKWQDYSEKFKKGELGKDDKKVKK